MRGIELMMHHLRIAIRAVIPTLAILGLMACDLSVDEPGLAPGNVAASSGSSASSVTVSWNAPAERDDEITLQGYQVVRTQGGSDTVFSVAASNTSYQDTSVSMGVLYTYRVVAQYSDASTASSSSTTGFALSSTAIQIGSSLGRYSVQYDTSTQPAAAGGKIWFSFLAQRGWTYDVSMAAGSSARLLNGSSLEAMPSSTTRDGDVAFRATTSDTVYLEISGSSGELSVRY